MKERLFLMISGGSGSIERVEIETRDHVRGKVGGTHGLGARGVVAHAKS